MTAGGPILVVHLEDDPHDAELVRETLRRIGLEVDLLLAASRAEFVAALGRRTPHLILSDYNLPDFDGLSALALSRELHPEVPFILVSGTIGEDRAIDVLKNGARDYVLKERLDKLPIACRRALKEAEGHRRAEVERRGMGRAPRSLNREARERRAPMRWRPGRRLRR